MGRLIVESEVVRVVEALRTLKGGVRPSNDPAWSRPIPIRVVDCVLSLNRNYDRFVVPRLEALMRAHPQLNTVPELATLIASYASPAAFAKAELNYDHADRARILAAVVCFVSDLIRRSPEEDEAAILRRWATMASPEEYRSLNIKGFRLAGYQYLRMLFGGQTTKPDKHIIGFVSESVGRRVSDVEALVLLEAAAERARLPLRDVDTSIWEARARSGSSLHDKTPAPNDHESQKGQVSRRARVITPAGGAWASSSQDFVRAARLLYQLSAGYARSNDGNVSIYALPGIPMLFSAIRCLLIELHAGMYTNSLTDNAALQEIAEARNDIDFILRRYRIPGPLQHDLRLLLDVRHEIIHPSHRPIGRSTNTPLYLSSLRQRRLLQSTNNEDSDYVWLSQLQSHRLFTWAFQTIEQVVKILLERHQIKPIGPIGLLDSYAAYRRIDAT